MKNYLKFSLLIAVATIVLVGCGSSSSSDEVASVDTGTGYYLDSAVEGVDFTCGTQSGVTDAEGKFVFEKGKNCNFELAGIKLREMTADELADGIKVVETNGSAAALLQTLDADGNASNGITIRAEVKVAVQEMIKEGKINLDEPIDLGVLTTISDTLKEEYSDVYDGRVVDEETALAHVQETLQEVTQELLAGKTFYVVDEEPDVNDTVHEVVFSNDLTSITVDGETASISVEGNKIIWSDNSYTLITVKDGYIYGEDYNSDGTIDGGTVVFADKNSADEYLQKKLDIKALLAGKTLYSRISNQDGTLESLTFNEDATSLTWKELIGGDCYGSGSISIDKFDVVFTAESDSCDAGAVGETALLKVTEITDDYISVLFVDEEEGSFADRLYFDEDKAKDYFLSSDTTESLTDLFTGQTFYLISYDSYNQAYVYDKIVFNSDLTSVDLTGIEGQDAGETFTLGCYIDGDKIYFSDTAETKYRMVIDIQDTYIQTQEYKIDENGTVTPGDTARLYYEQSDADEYYNSLQ